MRDESDNGNIKVFGISILLTIVLAFGRNFIDIRVSWVWVFVVAACLFVVEISIHEFGHCAVFLMVLVFVKQDGKWCIRRSNMQQMCMGGMVIPQIPCINSEEEYQDFRSAYAKALLGGPIATILFTLITVFICLILGQFFGDIRSECLLVAFLVIAIGTGFLLSTLKESSNDLGDLKAYRRMKSDSLWSNNIILNDENNSNLIRNRYTLTRADQFMQEGQFDFTMADFLTNVLELAIETENNPLTVKQEKVIHSILKTKDWLERLDQENYELFGYRLVQYLIVCEKDYVQAEDLYKRMIEKIRYKREYYDYYTFQCEQVLGITDHKEYLSQSIHIKTSSDWMIWNVFKEYYQREERINSRLCSSEV